MLTGYQNGGLVFVWALMKSKLGPFTVLRWLSEPFAQYGDILIAPDADARRWLRAAVGFIRRLKGIHSVRLRHVRADAAVYPFLAEQFRKAGEPRCRALSRSSPFVTEADYEKRYCKEQRRRRKRIRTNLEKMGPVNISKSWSPADAWIAPSTRHSRKKRRWLDERAVSIAARSPVRCSAPSFAISPQWRRLAESRHLLLTAGERTISWEIGLRLAAPISASLPP